ncbi:MAG: class B sortase [Ruminococcaceae bacterium]|nr:class B sortase [Oscillospiraceae bacterium]
MNRNIDEQLNNLCCDDIAPKNLRGKRPGYYAFQIIRAVLFLVCLAVFVYSVNSIIENFADYEEGEDVYESIKDQFESTNNSGLNAPIYSADKVLPLSKFDEMLVADGIAPPIVSNEEVEEFLKVKNKLSIMKRELPDLYGWIILPNTNINYPIMQCDDNSYYVTHTSDGKVNSLGAIFADFRCTKPAHQTNNLVLYGHNIRSWGTMFNGITNFFNPNYFESHRTIEVYTLDGIYEYEIIAVFETDIFDNYANVSFTNMKFSDFITETINKSTNSAGPVKYDDSSKLITLSTCSNSFDKDKRYALVGLMTKSITLD